jgi:hypothetical protein
MKPVIIFLFIVSTTICYSGETQITQNSYEDKDSIILSISKELLEIFKNKDYSELTRYIHPEMGVRFSPYAYIDTTSDQTFTNSTYNSAVKSTKKRIWGSFDGTGEPIRMKFKEYFKRFVYDVDFLNAEKTTLNTKSSHGSDLDNLNDIYPGSIYTESYFSGFDEKYGGMDWRALRLVYKEYEGKYYLVGIIHDEWTI